jgi:hypothetical protein
MFDDLDPALEYYVCKTLFDITPTGITGQFTSAKIPFTDRAGQHISDEDSWERSRNQQRNWDTMIQIISMRAQPLDLRQLPRVGDYWRLLFGTDAKQVFLKADNPVGLLEEDADMVPMSIGLGEAEPIVPPVIISTNGHKNTFFKFVRPK